MQRLLALSFLLLCGLAQAAPQQLTAIYHATRNGQPFAEVTETYVRQGDSYKLQSVTKGLGVYALFGKRILASEGAVTEQGLRPARFESQQSENPKRNVTAEFDWSAMSLTMKYRGKINEAMLEPGTQDLLSFAYQFMFRPPKGEQVVLPVTTGRKLRSYRYRVAERGVPLETAAGRYSTVHLVDAEPGEDAKEFWLGSEAHYIPVRITLHDDKGALIEQTLTSLHVE